MEDHERLQRIKDRYCRSCAKWEPARVTKTCPVYKQAIKNENPIAVQAAFSSWFKNGACSLYESQ